MKAYWWQGGLHIEPDTEEEEGALTLLVGALGVRIMDDDELTAALKKEAQEEAITNS